MKFELAKDTAKQFGQSLIEQAKLRIAERNAEQASGEIERLIVGLEVIEQNIAKAERHKEIYENRLAAINNGQFRAEKVNTTTGYVVKIVYNDDSLNEPC